MKRLHGILVVLLLLFFVGGVLAEDSPPVVEETQQVIAPVEESPVFVAAPADDAADWLSPELLLVVGALVFALGLGGSFHVILKALEAVKISVPQEVIVTFGNQLIETINQTRQTARLKAQGTDTPLDDMVVAVANVPLEYIVKEIERRTGSVPIELMAHLGLAEEVPKAEA